MGAVLIGFLVLMLVAAGAVCRGGKSEL